MSSSTDTCSSRHFTWLMKSCFPNPNHTIPFAAAITATATISSLSDDLLLECLTRAHQSSLAQIPLVCRRWAHLLNSPSFHILRRRNNLVFDTLFSISITSTTLYTATLRLDRPLWKVSSFVLSIGSDFSLFSHFRLVSIGRKIYVIGRREMLRCDTWTGTIVPKRGMGVNRKKFAAAVVAGKIYVAGGSASVAVEEYDPEVNEWRVVGEAQRRRYGCVGAAADGVFYVIGGLRPGEVPFTGVASSMDLYDVSARVWLRSRSVPGGGCVVAACGTADGHVYVLSSHAVELSFWRFNGVRKSKKFGEWRRVRAPPVPVRVDGTVRFNCVGVGEKVVLIQVAGAGEGLVMVYDCADGEWCRVADLPEVIRRAVCVSVEC